MCIYTYTYVCMKNFSIENDWREKSEMGNEMEGIRERQIGKFDTGNDNKNARGNA